MALRSTGDLSTAISDGDPGVAQVYDQHFLGGPAVVLDQNRGVRLGLTWPGGTKRAGLVELAFFKGGEK